MSKSTKSGGISNALQVQRRQTNVDSPSFTAKVTITGKQYDLARERYKFTRLIYQCNTLRGLPWLYIYDFSGKSQAALLTWVKHSAGPETLTATITLNAEGTKIQSARLSASDINAISAAAPGMRERVSEFWKG